MSHQFNNSSEPNDEAKMNSQQFFPGGFPQGNVDNRNRRNDRDRDRDRDERPEAPPGAPGMGAAPRSAPPSFTPEGPPTDQRALMGGPGGPGGAPNAAGRGFVRPGDFRRCMFRFTYIWLFNGNNFWFYPTFVGRQFVEGFRWRRNRWEYDRINIQRIFFFRCY